MPRNIYLKSTQASIMQARVNFFYRMMFMQACEKCNFYENQNQSSGSCRVNPPIVLKDDNKAVWPVVTVEDWCGRFENKAA